MITKNTIALLNDFLVNAQLKEHEIFPFGQNEYEAEIYVEVATPNELAEVVKKARIHDLPYHILGAGFTPGSESEIPGLVIKNNCRKFDMLSMKGVVTSGQTSREVAYVRAESGVPFNQLVRFTVDEGLAGLESYLGISGTLGDILMDDSAEAKEGESVTAHIHTLTVLTRENEMMEVSAEPFLYPLNENMIVKKQVIPLSVVFRLTPSEKSELWKKATQAAFERNQDELTDPLKGNFNLDKHNNNL